MAYLTKFYDQYNLPQKNQVVLDAELSLIQAICQPPAQILDVGCGTGRHLIPLTRLGYSVTGLDINPGMLDQLQQKLPTADIFLADIIKDLPSGIAAQKYDLIILMWNTLNEVALKKDQALKLFFNCRKLLGKNGKLLINTEDATRINPQQFNFTTTASIEGVSYTLTSKLVNWEPNSSTTTSEEQLKLSSGESHRGTVIQRWWGLSELTSLASEHKLQLEQQLTIPVNQELYLLFSNSIVD